MNSSNLVVKLKVYTVWSISFDTLLSSRFRSSNGSIRRYDVTFAFSRTIAATWGDDHADWERRNDERVNYRLDASLFFFIIFLCHPKLLLNTDESSFDTNFNRDMFLESTTGSRDTFRQTSESRQVGLFVRLGCVSTRTLRVHWKSIVYVTWIVVIVFSALAVNIGTWP